MKAVLLRAGSVPIMCPPLCGSPRVSLYRQSSAGVVFSGQRAGSSFSSPIMSLHFPMDKKKPKETQAQIRRAFSDTDLVRSESRFPGGSRCFPAGIPEEEYVSDSEVDSEFRTLVTGNGCDRESFAPVLPEFEISTEDMKFSYDGFGNGGKSSGEHGDDSYGEKSKIGDHYREMLKLNPSDPLLLRNYGKFLHEVKSLSINIFLLKKKSFHN